MMRSRTSRRSSRREGARRMADSRQKAEALLAMALETYRHEILPDLPPARRYAGAMTGNADDRTCHDQPWQDMTSPTISGHDQTGQDQQWQTRP